MLLSAEPGLLYPWSHKDTIHSFSAFDENLEKEL